MEQKIKDNLQLCNDDGIIPALSFTETELKKNSAYKIKPPRLMYEIWSSVPELKRGEKNVNRKLLERIFLYLKISTENTKQGILFKTLKKDVSNLESIRKTQYMSFGHNNII